MTRRLWVNFAAFSLLFVVLAVWAVRNVVQLDAIERPYPVTAQFETSPGLRSGFEVSYLGVRVGRLGTVKLDHGLVSAVLKLDRHTKLPAQLDAAVRRKSAVGEPYVDLSPTGGVDPGGARLRAGAVIPRARTVTPLEYSGVFTAIDDLLNAVPTADLSRLLDSLATGFQGRSADIRTIISSADQLTGTLVANAPLLDQLAGDLTQLTHTITQHRDAIGRSWDNLAALTATLAASKADLAALLDHTPTFVQDVSSLLTAAGPAIGCIFDSASVLWSSLDRPIQLQQFGQLVSLSGPTAKVVRDVAYVGPDGLYLNGTFTLNFGGHPVRTYRPPLQLPQPPTVPTCAGAAAAGAGAGGAGAAPASGAQPAAGVTAVQAPRRPANPADLSGSSTRQPGKGIDWPGVARKVVLAVALIGLVVLFAALRPWRPFFGKRADGRDEEMVAEDETELTANRGRS
jgi:phospholipid/cholesterol/gamma-HCH transport system substrate-binding protein